MNTTVINDISVDLSTKDSRVFAKGKESDLVTSTTEFGTPYYSEVCLSLHKQMELGDE